jgi:hypothetical protein
MSLVPAGVAEGVDEEVVEVEEDAEVVLVQIMRGHRIKARKKPTSPHRQWQGSCSMPSRRHRPCS